MCRIVRGWRGVRVRVSTDKQTVENQIAALSKVAEARGWQIVETFSDAGISGAKGRKDRPGLDALLKDAQRGRFDVVMAWAIDRLGRSLVDLLQTIESLKACNVDLYLDQQSIDTTTPAGKLMLQMCGAFAEFERSMLQARIAAMRTRVAAMLQAVQVARPALDKFYQSLSDEQKERFNVIDQDDETTGQRQADITDLCQRTKRDGPLLDRTEHILHLSNDQDVALKDLKEASAKAADLLKANCRSEQPITPTGRLAAMEERLNDIVQALDLVKAPLEKLYNSLSDEQKARFNRLGASPI